MTDYPIGPSGFPEWSSEDGSVRLINADCLAVLPTLEAGSVDAVVTDAPYGIGYDASQSTQQGIQPFEKITGDGEAFDVSPWLPFYDVLVWCLPQLTLNVPQFGAWYAWDKTTRNDLRCRISEYEYAWHKMATKTRGFRHLWSGAYRASEANRKRVHPTQKPIVLMTWCLKFVYGETVLDPYLGSGTTGVACIRTCRRFIGIEIEPKYFDIAVARCKAELNRFPLLEPARPTQRSLL